jgi:hypothetical protein
MFSSFYQSSKDDQSSTGDQSSTVRKRSKYLPKIVQRGQTCGNCDEIEALLEEGIPIYSKFKAMFDENKPERPPSGYIYPSMSHYSYDYLYDFFKEIKDSKRKTEEELKRLLKQTEDIIAEINGFREKHNRLWRLASNMKKKGTTFTARYKGYQDKRDELIALFRKYSDLVDVSVKGGEAVYLDNDESTISSFRRALYDVINGNEEKKTRPVIPDINMTPTPLLYGGKRMLRRRTNKKKGRKSKKSRRNIKNR